MRSNGKRVDDIKLPKWAHSPAEFLTKNREALESNYVSEHIHLWIDLIFGTKQCSIEDQNVFHPVTYQGRIDLDQLSDPVQRAALEVQITEFGQTPKQIFFANHPQRFSKIPKPQQLQQEEGSSAQSEAVSGASKSATEQRTTSEELKQEPSAAKRIIDDLGSDGEQENKAARNANVQPPAGNASVPTAGSQISRFQELDRFTKQKVEGAHK